MIEVTFLIFVLCLIYILYTVIKNNREREDFSNGFLYKLRDRLVKANKKNKNKNSNSYRS